MVELILSADTIEEGRVKINAAYSQDTHIWISGDTSTSIVANNSTGNKVESSFSSAIGGESNEIINDTGASNNSVVVGGAGNFISGNSTSMSSAIIGGEGNKVLESSCVYLGGSQNNSNFSAGTETLYVEGLKTHKSRFKNANRMTYLPALPIALSLNGNLQVLDFYQSGLGVSASYPAINIDSLVGGGGLVSSYGKTVEIMWNAPEDYRNTGLTIQTTNGTDWSLNGDNASSGTFGTPHKIDLFYTGYSGSFTLLYSGEEVSGRRIVYAFGANIFT